MQFPIHQKLTVGIQGESLGSATTLQYAAKYQDKDVSFYIAESGWSDLGELYMERSKDYKIPSFIRPVLISYLSLMCKLKSGFFLSDNSSVDAIEHISAPVLIMHSDTDDFIPFKMSQDLYDNKSGEKSFYVIKGGKHGHALEAGKEEYKEAIVEFLEKYVNTVPIK